MEKNCWNFYQKELQKTNQIQIRLEKVTKKKGEKIYVKWKEYRNSFNNWIHKNVLLRKLCHCLKQDIYCRNKIKVELDLSNYETKFDLKRVTGVDTTDFAKELMYLT